MTPSITADVLLVATMAVLAVHLFNQKRHRTFFAFDPIIFFWVGVFVIYIIDVLSNYSVYVGYFGEDVIQDVLFYVFIAVVFLHFGYRIPVGLRLGNRLPSPARLISPLRMLWLSCGLIAFGLVGWSLQIMTAGSFAAWASVPRGGEDWEQLSGYVSLMASFLSIGIAMLVLHTEMHNRGLLLRLASWILLLLLILFFFYLGSRSRVIATVVGGMMVWYIPRRKNPSVVFCLCIFACLFVVTSFQAQYRGNFNNFSLNLGEIDWETVPSRILPSIITGEASGKPVSLGSEFGMTSAVVQLVPDRVPYALGYEFRQFLTQPIPRSLWTEKRYPRGEMWSEIHLRAGTSTHWIDYIHVPYLAGPSPGYVASWLYNGGILGLLIGGLLTGTLFRFVRTIYDRSRDNQGFVVMYVVLAPIGFSEATSHPFGWAYTLPLVLIPLLIFLLLTRVRRRRAVTTGLTLGLFRRRQAHPDGFRL